MNVYTEQYEIALRDARRELRDSQAKRRQCMQGIAALAVSGAVLGVVAVGLFYVEHLQPYTPEEARKIAGGGDVGPSFYGGCAIAAMLFAIVAWGCALFYATVWKPDHLVPTRTDLAELADKVEDAQADLDDAKRREEEEAVRKYAPETWPQT